MRGICVGLAALLLSLSTASARAPLETRGAWSIVADGEDFALRTQAAGNADTTFSLYCRKEHRLFALEIKSPALASRPQADDARIAFQVDDADRVWLNVSNGPDGTVPITDRTHNTGFWIIHSAIASSGAKQLAFSVGDHTWQFALDGFADLNESLNTRCKFPPARSTR